MLLKYLPSVKVGYPHTYRTQITGGSLCDNHIDAAKILFQDSDSPELLS